MANITLRLSDKPQEILLDDKVTAHYEIILRFRHGKGGAIDKSAGTKIFATTKQWQVKNDKPASDKNADGEIKIPHPKVLTDMAKRDIELANSKSEEVLKLKSFVTTYFSEHGGGSIALEKDWLKTAINSYYGIKTDEQEKQQNKNNKFLEAFETYPAEKDLSLIRTRQYKSIQRALQRFELYKQLKDEDFTLTFDSITPDILTEFVDFLDKEHELAKKDSYKKIMEAVPDTGEVAERGINTKVNILKKIRAIFNWANGKGGSKQTDNDPFRNGFHIGSEKYVEHPYFITIEERKRLEDYDFSNYIPKPKNDGKRHKEPTESDIKAVRSKLSLQRDIFVFQCLIGCRVGDLWKMKKKDIVRKIVGGKETYFVEYVPRKTQDKKPVTISVSLNNTAMAILARYTENYKDNALFPFYTQQEYNRDIKEMFEAAGLDRMVTTLNTVTDEQEKKPLYQVASSHMARRAFIGNLYKQLKDPNLIAPLSGHVEGSKAFARYRDIDDETKIQTTSLLG